MRYIIYSIILIPLFFVAACSETQQERILTAKEKAAAAQKAKEHGEIRRSIFNDCMDFASKLKVQKDENIPAIIKQCSSSSYYMSNSYYE